MLVITPNKICASLHREALLEVKIAHFLLSIEDFTIVCSALLSRSLVSKTKHERHDSSASISTEEDLDYKLTSKLEKFILKRNMYAQAG